MSGAHGWVLLHVCAHCGRRLGDRSGSRRRAFGSVPRSVTFCDPSSQSSWMSARSTDSGSIQPSRVSMAWTPICCCPWYSFSASLASAAALAARCRRVCRHSSLLATRRGERRGPPLRQGGARGRGWVIIGQGAARSADGSDLPALTGARLDCFRLTCAKHRWESGRRTGRGRSVRPRPTARRRALRA